MLNDKKLLQLIRYIELEYDGDYIIGSSLINKIRIYGYDLFKNTNLLTSEESRILDIANKTIKGTKK